MALAVLPITAQQHLAYIQRRPSVSFLQTPAWAAVKNEWGNLTLGWFDGDELIGAGLVLTRKVPKIDRYLAYLPEGPDLDWSGDRTSHSLSDWLDPMLALLKKRGAFLVKMGPTVPVNAWSAATLKDAIAGGEAGRLRDVEPDQKFAEGRRLIEQLRANGWTQKADTGAGFGDVQPRYVFGVPLRGRTQADVFAGFNQLWRRNIRKAEKVGVEVRHGGRDDLPAFHKIYLETAARDGFVPRGLDYFQNMWDAMSAESGGRIRLYLASYGGEVLAATTMVSVGTHSWYSYGASADAGREVRPSNAIQWRMICDCLEDGATVYDMRGISDTLDESDPLFGLIRFKLGTGGRALEYVGEWDYALRPSLARAFDVYLRRADIKASVTGKFGKAASKTGRESVVSGAGQR